MPPTTDPTPRPMGLPTPGPVGRTTRRRRPGRRILLAVAGAGVVGIVAVNAVAGASGTGGFRTATVRRSTVEQTLHDTGTVEPVSQVSVAFPVAGTVATVDVALGSTVTTGQQLATLDGAALQRAIDTAQAALDQAELTLEQARTGQLSGGLGSTGGDGGNGARNVSLDGEDATIQLASATQSVDDAITEAQDRVLDGQREVDDRLLAAQDALDSAQDICAAVGDEDGAAAASTAATGDPSTTSSSSTSTTVDASASIDACRTALTTVLDAQRSVSDAQTALSDAARALDDLLAQQAASNGSADQSAPTGSDAPDGSTDGSGSTSPSAADLIAYQKAVDEAEAKLAVAQQALKQATIVSPIDGTITAVDLAVGDAVTAGSTTSRILVEGPGGYEVTARLAVDRLPKVDVGQRATVVPDGSDRALRGQVVSIGLAATSSSGATTYPVTIALDDDEGLRNGSVASVSIVTDDASDVLVVPTSAVRPSGGTHSVIVLDDGKATSKEVQIGAVGPSWTEITSGLTEGQQVVLADLDEPLPSSATSSSNGDRGGGNGRFPVIQFGGPGRALIRR